MDEKRVLDISDRFYRAFLAADREALAKVVAPNAAWTVPLQTAVSGVHIGPDGIVAPARQAR